MTTEKLAYTTQEAADLIGVSVYTMRELTHRKGFPKLSNGRKIIIPKAAFEEWLDKEARKS